MNEPRSLNVKGRTVHYFEFGDRSIDGQKKKTLLLIHGFGINSKVWEDIIPKIEAQYKVLALDLAGYGVNNVHDNCITFEEQAQYLNEFIQAYGNIDYLVGYSYGGRVVYEYAKNSHPSIKRIFVIASPYLTSSYFNRLGDLFSSVSKAHHMALIARTLFSRPPLVSYIVLRYGIARLFDRDTIDRCCRYIRQEQNIVAIFKSISYMFRPFTPAKEVPRTPITWIYGTHDKIGNVNDIKDLIKVDRQDNLYTVPAFHLLIFTHSREIAQLILASAP